MGWRGIPPMGLGSLGAYPLDPCDRKRPLKWAHLNAPPNGPLKWAWRYRDPPSRIFGFPRSPSKAPLGTLWVAFTDNV